MVICSVIIGGFFTHNDSTRGMTAMYRVFSAAAILAVSTFAYGSALNLSATGAGSVTIPAGYTWTNVTVQCWGGGGGASDQSHGGGGGGAYAFKTYTSLAAGNYSYYVGAGGTGFSGNIFAPPESGGVNTIWNYGGTQDIIAGSGGAAPFPQLTGGTGGAVLAGTGYAGGAGGSGFSLGGGGGGGASGGPSGPGGAGGNAGPLLGGNGGLGYGDGGAGGDNSGGGNWGTFPGGGGGAADAPGAGGEIIVTYTQQAVPEPSAIALLLAAAIGLLAMAWWDRNAKQ
jgi:hypothetical protein